MHVGAKLLKEELNMLRNATDAVSDLLISKRVYQAVRSNLLRSDGKLNTLRLC